MLNRLKISLILAPLALTMLVGVYIYTLWAKERERIADIPFDSTGAMNRDLLKFHKKRGSFPVKLEDLEGIIWEKKERNYVSDGRSLIHRNYFYVYARVNHHQFTLWAIPIGKEREEASTFFFVGNPESNRTWKGPAVPLTDIDKVSLSPTTIKLNILGLVEQPNTPAEMLKR
ncbi:MAG: hypothetical protein WBD22_09345 [Pyrinomonadaceae bacterium]